MPRFNLNPLKPKPLISNTIQQKKKLCKKSIASLPEHRAESPQLQQTQHRQARPAMQGNHQTNRTMYLIMPPTRRINRRRPSATRRALTRAAMGAALIAAAYGLAYLITTAVMI